MRTVVAIGPIGIHAALEKLEQSLRDPGSLP